MSDTTRTDHLTPLERDALLAAYNSPTRSLVRIRDGYMAQDQQHGRVFTGRLMNMLDRDGLVDFDPPTFPARVLLNSRGLAAAQQLAAEQGRKAVRA